MEDKVEYDLNAFQIDLDAPKSTKNTNAALLAYEKAIPLNKANAAYDHVKVLGKEAGLTINEFSYIFCIMLFSVTKKQKIKEE